MRGTVLETGITSPQRSSIDSNEFNKVTKRERFLISKAIFLLFLIRQWNSNCHRLTVVSKISNREYLLQGNLSLVSLLPNYSIAYHRIQGKQI